MIFTERYKDQVNVLEGNKIVDKICGNDVDYYTRQQLVDILSTFNQSCLIHTDRYDYSKTITTDSFSLAIARFFEARKAKGYRYNNIHEPKIIIANQSLGNIFDVVEYLYNELSDPEKINYTTELNDFLNKKELPWRMLDGKMIKIDAQQFECDLKLKALAQMQELKDAEPKFQSAYTELTTAVEALEKEDYQSAINNAGKSYESILKVILGADRGNADKLTNQYMDQLLSVPDTMTKAGFREKVMMSLPYVRNNSGADHGAGEKVVVISKPMAKLAVNLAAALDTYLIEEYMQDTASSN